MKTLIIQYSPMHTASTVLINALYGLIPSLCDSPILFAKDVCNYNVLYLENDISVLKTHCGNIDEIIHTYGNDYTIYFICSERIELDLFVDEKYKLYDNVIIFSFSELNETDTYTVPNIIENIYAKIVNKLNIELNIEGGINRIVQMNKLYEEIKNYEFQYYDKFYHIHGSHRNRAPKRILTLDKTRSKHNEPSCK